MRLGQVLGGPSIGKQKWFIFLIVFMAFVVTRLFSIQDLPLWGKYVYHLVPMGLGVWFICHSTKNSQCHFRVEVLLLMWLPWLSSINTLIHYNQSLLDSAYVMKDNFLWVPYFIFHRYRVSEGTVLRAIFLLAFFVAMAQIIQQITYPHAVFGVFNDETLGARIEIADKRNGLWRFRMPDNGYFGCVGLFALWCWLRDKMDKKMLILAAILLVSVYLTLTRQVIAACILAIFCSYIIGGRRLNAMAIILGLLVIVGLYIFWNVLFSELGEQTVDEANDDYIRVWAARYFFNESLKDPFLLLFGYGLPGTEGEYAKHMNIVEQVYAYWPNDVGFIGKTYEYGLIYVIVCYRMFYRMFFTLKKVTPMYIRMFVIFAVAMSPMIFPMYRMTYWLVWTMLLYVCDLHINRSPLALASTIIKRN